jgi:outer membrane protein assembly factor BamB
MPRRSPAKPAPGRAAARAAVTGAAPARAAATRVAVLAVVVLLCWPAAASAAQTVQAAGDWTRWRYDAANTGVNPGETRLGPGNVRGLRRSWFRSLCCGGGTPLVAGGVVYLGAAEGPDEPGAVYALDAATGRTRWLTRTGAAQPPGGLAMAGGRLFTLPVGGGQGSPMVALDAATGRRLWTTDLTPGTSTDFYPAPNVAGGVVYVTGGDAKMRAVDAATGRLLWRAYVTRTQGATGTAAVSGGLAYVVSTDGVLLAKDAATGVNRWKASLADGGGRGGPVGTVSVGGGRVFVATEGGSVLAYAAAGCRPALVCRPVWVRQGGAATPFDSTPAVGRTTVFVGGPNRLNALDAATGRRRWSGVVEGSGEDFTVTTPVVANGVIYATTVGNRVHAFASAGCGSSSCRPLWSGVINPEVDNSTATFAPSVSGGALYATAWVAGVTRFAVPNFPG